MQMKLLQFSSFCQGLTACQDGQDLVEYALLLTMISLALVSAIGSIAQCVTTVFTDVSSSIAAA